MIRTVGMIEFNSIAKGIETADFMIKAAEVELLFAKAICPGKFIILVAGDVAAVNASIETGLAGGGVFVVDHLMLPRVHPQVIHAINATTAIDQLNALGVMEFFSVAAAVTAADIAVKTAQVDLIEIRLGIGIGGKSFVTLTGDVSAVTEAVEGGVRYAQEQGMLVHRAVIPSPGKELFQSLL